MKISRIVATVVTGVVVWIITPHTARATEENKGEKKEIEWECSFGSAGVDTTSGKAKKFWIAVPVKNVSAPTKEKAEEKAKKEGKVPAIDKYLATHIKSERKKVTLTKGTEIATCTAK